MLIGKSSGLFGMILPSDNTVVDGYINGLEQADGGFLSALIRYSSRFTNFQLFSADGELHTRQAFWDEWLVRNGLSSRKKVTIFPLDYLPASLATDNYSFFYGCDFHLSYLLELRRAFALHDFSIVGRVHGLSRDVSFGAWHSLLHGDSAPGDALLCGSEVSRQAVNNLLEEAGSRSGDKFSGQVISLPSGVDGVIIHDEKEVSREELSKKKIARVELGLPEDGVILLSMGRLSPVDKADLHPLLQAFSELYDRYEQENCYLYICGQAADDDDYVVSLARHAGQLGIDSQVLFNFELSAEQRHLVFSAVDIFVSVTDSVQESCDMAPVLAMSAGLPVILPDWGCYSELIESGRQGILVPTCWGNVDGLSAPTAFLDPRKASLIQAQSVVIRMPDLVEALHKLVINSQLRQVMGRQGCQTYNARHHWVFTVNQFDAVAENLQLHHRGQLEPSGHLHSLHYHRAFSGYGTKDLTRGVIVKTTLAGRQVLSGQTVPLSFCALEAMLPVQYLSGVLAICMAGACLADVRQRSDLARAQTDILVLWALKHGLLQELAEPVVGSSSLLRHYQRRKSLASAQGLKKILLRIQKLRSVQTRRFRLDSDNELVSITPLSEKGYLGACLALFHYGTRLVYRPVDMSMTLTLNQNHGLLKAVNSWCGRPFFFIDSPVMTGRDRFGPFGFRRYIRGEGTSPSVDMYTLGMFSAFALFAGMSDLHRDNFLFQGKSIVLLDSEMTCRQDVLSRLYKELCLEERPESWQASSLAATRIEMLWQELREQGWLPNKAVVEQIVDGFRKACELVSDHVEEWLTCMNNLADCPCRYDPIPLNSALPVMEQLEKYDLHSVSSIKELKKELLIQARRMLRNVEYDGDIQSEAVEQVNCWITGQHRSLFLVPDDLRGQIQAIGQALKQKQVQVGFIWLSTLYQEWLEEAFGLDW